MLDMMRKQSYLIYPIFGGIILIFAIQFGPGQSGCSGGSKQTWAAKVDGEVIRQREFALLYGRQMEYMRRLAERSGSDFEPAMAERMGLPKQVLDQLVDKKLLAKQAAARGLQVTNAELRDFLHEQYGTKDVNYDTYESWVTRTFDITVSRFEEEAREEVAAQRLVRLVADSLMVGDVELEAEFKRDHDRAKIDFVRFDADLKNATEPPPAALQKILAEEGAALEAQYTKNIGLYRTAPQLRVRQIVRHLQADKAEATGSDAEKKSAKEKLAQAQQEAEAALSTAQKRVAAGEDFALVAQELSQDSVSAQKGGDLGWLSEDQLARPLAEAVKNLAPGAVSPTLVKTPMGLHLVQLMERKEAQSRELSEVRQEVAVSLYKDRAAQAVARQQAQELLTKLQAGQSLVSLTADEEGSTLSLKQTQHKAPLVRRRTAWIKRSDAAISRIGIQPELRTAVFALDEAPEQKGASVLPKVYEVEGSFVVACLAAREHPDLKQFAADKEELLAEALHIKRQQVVRDWLAHLRGQSKVQMNPAVFGTRSAAG